jgi:hypothetical protein
MAMAEHGELIIRGARIGQDGDGYLSLNDMWRASGEGDSKAPRFWRRLPTTLQLIEALGQSVRYSHSIVETASKSAIYAKMGKHGGVFAHHILALAYAEYLNPRIGIEVREIALRFWAGDLTLLDDFMRAKRRQAHEDGQRVFLREEIRAHNQVLNQRVRNAGATQHYEFAEFHNAGYKGLYAGLDENAIHRRKELSKEQKILDHMMPEEAAANWFRTTQAESRLRNDPVQSLDQACVVHHDTGERIRTVIQQMGSTMPEDVPVADGIGDAKRRLRDYRKGGDTLT